METLKIMNFGIRHEADYHSDGNGTMHWVDICEADITCKAAESLSVASLSVAVGRQYGMPFRALLPPTNAVSEREEPRAPLLPI